MVIGNELSAEQARALSNFTTNVQLDRRTRNTYIIELFDSIRKKSEMGGKFIIRHDIHNFTKEVQKRLKDLGYDYHIHVVNSDQGTPTYSYVICWEGMTEKDYEQYISSDKALYNCYQTLKKKFIFAQ